MQTGLCVGRWVGVLDGADDTGAALDEDGAGGSNGAALVLVGSVVVGATVTGAVVVGCWVGCSVSVVVGCSVGGV